jgi:hypothetical protein
MDELHDVAAQTPSNNDGLFYNSTNSLWENKSIATALGYTPANAATTLTINGVTFDLSTSRTFTVGSVTGSGASGQVAYWDGTTSQAGSNNLFWDNANGRLGIGTNAPIYTIEMRGARFSQTGTTTTAATTLHQIIDNTSTVNNSYVLFGVDINGSNTGFNQQGTYLSTGRNGTGTLRPIILHNYDSQPIIFATGNTERARIFGTGNFGIGTGSTDSGQRLQVQGTTLLNGNVTFSSATGMFWDATNSRLGIGTNTPTANLSVVKNINGDNTFYVLNNSNGTSARNLFLFGEDSSGGTYGTLQYINSGYSSSGLVTANTTILSGHSTGGVTIAAIDATGTIKFGAGNSSSALMTLTATGALRFNSPSGSNNTYLEGVNSSGILVSRISEASTVGSGGLYFQGARVDATSGGAMLFAGYVGSSGNTSAFEFRGVGGTISTIADLPSAIPIAIFSKRSGGATVNQMMLFQTGNLLIQNGGTFTDSGERLQVTGTAVVKDITTSSVASALFQLSSTTKGFLPPRMTTTQKNAIATPAAGLVVYDTTLAKLCVYTTAWETITSV